MHTRCLNQSGQIHVWLAANKVEISSDGSPEQIYSVNNKYIQTPVNQIKAILNNRLLYKAA